jgi:hypothetical protein
VYRAIFGFDFSCNKPAMTSCIDGVYEFYVWPSELDDKEVDRLESLDVHVYNRNLPKIKDKSLDQHELIIEHVNRANNLSEIIIKTILDKLFQHGIPVNEAVIANEGFAFSAKGDAALQLAGYKYVLMNMLMRINFAAFKTYSPITIKKTANCSKKGLGKDAMITALSNEDIDNHFVSMLHDNPQYLKKKTNYIHCIDDIADSYWCLKTCMNDLCQNQNSK